MSSTPSAPVKKKKEAEDKLKPLRRNAWILFGLGLIIVLAAPSLFTLNGWEWFNFRNTGQIGDTIGGIAGPIINAISALLIFLSFYQQVKANNILSDQVIDQKKREYIAKVLIQLERIIYKLHFSEEIEIDPNPKEEPPVKDDTFKLGQKSKGLLDEFYNPLSISTRPIKLPPYSHTETSEGFDWLLEYGSQLHYLYCKNYQRFVKVFSDNLQRELLHFLRIMNNLCNKIDEEDGDSSAEVIQLIYWQESYLDSLKIQLENISKNQPVQEFDQKANKFVEFKGPELISEMKNKIDEMVKHLTAIKLIIDSKKQVS